jgi:energy-coupling factor transporter ATP-binding protein EcfA2
MDTLAEINEKDKKTVLLVTHDAKYLPYAHRIVYMSDGRVERIVPNPEKKQILKLAPGTTIVTEIEQISRIYPYDSPSELQVKSIVNYLTQDFTFDQIVRIERLTEQVLVGRMDGESYLRLLMAPYESGGAGVAVAEASKMAKRLTDILERSRDIMRYRRSAFLEGAKVHARGTEYVNRIAEYIATELSLQLDASAKRNFEDIIAQRIGGFTKKDDFKQQLLSPVSEGGVGLPYKTMHDTTRLMEKLIAIGVQRVGSGHH